MPTDSNLMFYILETQARQPKTNRDYARMYIIGTGKQC